MADADPAPSISIETAPPKPKRSWWRVPLMLSVPAALGLGGWQYYQSNAHFVSTDNAYVKQSRVSVASELGGRIIAIAVKENQAVNVGDLLFKIDPEPYRLAIAESDAEIAAAQVKVTSLQTEYQNSGTDIDSAREDVAFYTEEYNRQSALMERGFTTRARLQAAQHALSDARSKVAKAQNDAAKARAALSTGQPKISNSENPALLSAKVRREQAVLSLSKTEVRSPMAGVISQADRLQIGQMMVQGLPALSIVANNDSWIEANFKETDLDKMHIGQPVTISFDAYPELKLRGRVASIGAGTGSEFSVLPAQNANGNWVKVTQRVPVRISVIDKSPRQLIAGLSAHVTIDTNK
jgi:membrane fusion protein, multidrug efflux system